MPETPDAPDAVAALQASNARLRAENAELKAQLAEQAEKIARLERLISRNSGNSPMPPSTDDDRPGKKPPQRRPRSGGTRKPGKQPGAPGAYLAWNDQPDDVIPHFPEGTCGCGADLAGAGTWECGTPIRSPTCPGRGRGPSSTTATKSDAAAGAPGTVTYGLNFQAWCVFLVVMHHVPVERCADILEPMSGTRPSDGWVHALLARAAATVRHVNMLIRALVITAGVVCADETPIRVGPGPKSRKRYLLVACTNLLTCYFLGDRTLASFDGFVFPDLSGSVAVHDRYQNYDAFAGVAHQLCCAHVLRDLAACAQTYPDAIWPGQAADALRALIHAANQARARDLDAAPGETITADLRLFRSAVLVGLQEVRRVPGAKARQKPGRTLLECLRDREADILRFLSDLRIPPPSNQAERDLRPAKTQQKISGRLRSENAARDRYAIRGYASTAVKHGTGALTAIRDALAGNAWMPPVPEAA